MWLNLDNEELKIVEDKFLIGRPRFSSMIPIYIDANDLTLSKIEILQNAIAENKKEISTKLLHRLVSSIKKMKNRKKRLDLLDIMRQLYIKAKLQVQRIYLPTIEDFLNIGLVVLQTRTSGTDYCVVAEPLALQVLIKAYEKLTGKDFGQLVNEYLTVEDERQRGQNFQLICSCMMKMYCNQQPNLTVYNFLKQLYGEKEYPEWTKLATFHKIESIGNYKALGWRSDNEIIEFMVKNPHHELLLLPQNEARPDMLSLNLLQNNDYWSLLMSTKLLKRFSDRTSDKNSTNIQLLYFTTDGKSINPKAVQKRESFEDTILKKYKNVGSLRLHIVLYPRTEEKTTDELIQIEENGDVVVYFNLDIFKKFCSPGCSQIFETVSDIVVKNKLL